MILPAGCASGIKNMLIVTISNFIIIYLAAWVLTKKLVLAFSSYDAALIW